ncbi:Protein SRG1 [Linum perenne]
MEEGKELIKLGSSLPVPYVQELAKDPLLAAVPPRYIRRDDQDRPLDIINPTVQVPVIDVEKLYDDDEDQELGRLHEACKDWGFFQFNHGFYFCQLVNHGVSDSLLERVKAEVTKWFNIPMEEKKKFWQRAGDMEGYGQAFVVSEEQKLDWGDMFYVTTLPTHLRRPHLFPMLPLPLRDTLEEYSAALKILAMKILNQMAKALRMDEKEMKVLFEEEGWQQFRMNYYPPILLQVTADTQGLQVKKDGYWVPVMPLAGALIVNVGDILEIVSNGVYRSIEHRATVNSEKERISVATFLSPRLDGEIGPAPSLVTPNSPAQFRRISVPDYFKGYFSRELIGKSYVDVMRIHNHS